MLIVSVSCQIERHTRKVLFPVFILVCCFLFSLRMEAQIFPVCPGGAPAGDPAGNPDAVVAISGNVTSGVFIAQSDELCIQGDNTNFSGCGEDPEWKLNIAIPNPGQVFPSCSPLTLRVCRRGDFGQSSEELFVLDENLNEIGSIPGAPQNSSAFDCTNEPICTIITVPPCSFNDQGTDGIFELSLYTNGDISGNSVGDFCDMAAGPQGDGDEGSCTSDPFCSDLTQSSGGVFEAQANGGPIIDSECVGCNCIFLDYISFELTTPDTDFALSNTEVCVGDAIVLTPDPTICEQSWTVNGGTADLDMTSGVATFTPSSDGTFTICNLVGDATCPQSSCQSVIVNPLPTVSAGSYPALCENADPITLTGSPVPNAGEFGVWTGSGVSDPSSSDATASFDPSAAGPGVHMVTYQFADNNGCLGMASTSIEVLPVETVTFDAGDDLCVNGSAITLTGSPSGGTFSGLGVSGNTFDPSSAGIGIHTLTYTYLGGNGCAVEVTDDIEVFALPTLTFNAGPDVCVDDGPVSLFASPSSGTFSGTGITGTTFDPSVAGVGIHTITYTYTDGDGCSNTTSDDIVVQGLPNVSFELFQDMACEGDPSIALSGGSPSGGTYSGTAVSGTLFSVATVIPGDYTITYTFTDDNGCTNSADDIITVNPLPAVTLDLGTTTLCANDAPIVLSGGMPAGGTYGGLAVSGNAFDPGQVAPGISEVTYTFVDANGCANIATDNITIESIPEIFPSAPECSADLMTYMSDINVSSGNMLTADAGTLVDNGAGVFSLTDVPTGTDVTLTVTDPASGCQHTVVLMSPDCGCPMLAPPTSPENGEVCEGGVNPDLSVQVFPGETVDWYDMPSGGTALATSTLSYMPTPTAAGVYTFFAETRDPLSNCIAIPRTEVTLTIFDLPTVALTLAVDEVCEDAQSVALAGGSPAGGTYSGTAVAGALFDVSSAGVGTFPITYTYVDANGCENSTTEEIIVNPLPIVSLNLDVAAACQDADPITLTGGSPAGGVYFGNGLEGDIFNPIVAGVGLHTITYSFTDASGCTNTAEQDFEVYENPVCNILALQNVSCQGDNDGSVSVSGGSGSLTYEIAGLPAQNNGLFTGLSAGDYTISVTDSNGCSSNCEVTITEPAALSCSNVGTNILCNAAADGTITTMGTGGVGPYEYSLDGAPFQIGNQFSGVDVGSHIVTVRDGNLCLATCSISLSEPTPLECTLAATPQSDCDVNDGSITVTPSGGTQPYQFSIDGAQFQTEATFTDLMPGIYTVTIEDMNACTSTCEIEVMAQEVPTCSLVETPVTCYGLSDGIINITGMGGSGTYEYSLDGVAFQSSSSFTDLLYGTYTVTIRDQSAPSCQSTCMIEVTQPPMISCMTTTTALACNGDSDGEITINAIGGSGNLEYSIDGTNFQISNIFSGLSAGTYNVTVRDADTPSCSSLCDVVEIENPEELICSLASTMPLCNAGDDATITVSATGGTGDLEYSLDGLPFQPGTLFSDLTAGTYTVTVRDANGCTTSCTETITEPEPLVCTTASTDVTDCGVNDGTITTTEMGGTAGYTYDAGAGTVSGNVISDLAPGSYVVTVTDANGCTTTCTAEIMGLDVPTCTIDNVVNVDCNGNATGSFEAIGEGGNSGTYNFTDGTTTNADGVFTMLATGTYMITVSDQSNAQCSSVCAVEITEPEVLTCAATLISNVSCNGAADGSASVTVAGGTPGSGIVPFMYAWDNGETTATAVMLTAGIHTVEVTDANGCMTTCDVVIEENMALTCMIAVTANVSCNGESDGSLEVAPTGGDGNYQFSLNGGPFQPGASFAGLPAGVSTVTVMDDNGCTSTCMATITQPMPLGCMTITTDVTDCGVNDGTIEISATGGTAGYFYDAGAGTVTNNLISDLMPGTYIVTVTDANGCTSACEATIGGLDMPTCSINNVVNVDCNGNATGSFEAIGEGGNSGTYNFTDGMTTNTDGVFTMLAAGAYMITVSDQSNTLCSSVCAVEITEPEILTCAATLISNVSCNGAADGSASVAVAGGTPGSGIEPFTYAWDNGETTATAVMLTAGIHTVEVTDANGCMTTCDVVIEENMALTCMIAVTANVSCNGESDGSLEVAPTGGDGNYQFSLNGGPFQPGASFAGLPAGVSTVTVMDDNGCTSTCMATITQPMPLGCMTITTDVTDCGVNDGTIEISATGGTAGYFYDAGAGTVTNNLISDLMPGTYIVTVTDANGCTSACEATIGGLNMPTCSINNVVNVDCNGNASGSFVAIGEGGNSGTYNFDDGTTTNTDGVFTMLASGTYMVTVSDQSNALCSSVCTVEITEPEELTCEISIENNVSCNGEADGSATVMVAGGTASSGLASYSYLWDNGEMTVTATALDAGVHTVEVTDANGCLTTCQVMITENMPLTCNLVVASNVLCNGGDEGALIVSANGGDGNYEYSLEGAAFQPGSNYTGLTAGIYSVTVRDGLGCTTTCAASIGEPAVIECSLVTTDESDCGTNDGMIDVQVFNGVAPFTYSLDDGITAQTENPITGLVAGTYTVLVTDANGCTTRCTGVIESPTAPSCEIVSSNNVSCNGFADGAVTVSATGATGAYNFDNGTTTNMDGVFTGLAAGVYAITVSDQSNPLCSSVCSVEITEPEALVCAATLISDVSCNGADDGSASVTVAGGTVNSGLEPYTYLWDNGETTATATMLSAGVHIVTVTDANGCLTTCDVEISQNPPLTCTLNVTSNVLCNGGNEGSVSVDAVGGDGTYEYSLDGGFFQPGSTYSDLVAGIYNVTIRDGRGCTSTCAAQIGEPAELTCMLTTTDESDCGTSDGMIDVQVFNGASPLTYSLDGGTTVFTSNPITGLVAGNYTVLVTDGNGCTTTCTGTIGSPTAPTCEIVSTTNISCNGLSDGTINVLGSGGTGAYNFDSGVSTNTDGAFSMLVAGNYIITVTDQSNPLCSSVCSVELTQPDLLECATNLVSNVSCNGGSDGSATVVVAGGTANSGLMPYAYNWDNGETTATATGLNAGLHTVVITDANGCSVSCDITIEENPQLTCDLVVAQQISCGGGADGSVMATANGGDTAYAYSLNGSAFQPGNTFEGLSAGNYVMTVRDGLGCTTTCSVELVDGQFPSCTLETTDETDCGVMDGTIMVTVVDGLAPYRYSVDGGASYVSDNPITGLAAGTYTVMVEDANGCTTSCVGTVDTPTAPTCWLIGSTDATCNGAGDGTIEVAGAGGSGIYEYSIDGVNFQSTGVFTGLTAGFYSVTVRNQGDEQCVSDCHVTINEPTALSCFIIAEDMICSMSIMGSLTVNSMGGSGSYLYSLDGTNFQPSNVFEDLSGGTYTVTVMDANSSGCITTCMAEIVEVMDTPVSLTLDVDQVCETEDFVVLSGGTPIGGTYSGPGVVGNLVFIESLGPGSYTIEYTYVDALGCTNTASDILEVVALPAIAIDFPQSAYCINDPAIVLTGATPMGGSYSGMGISGGVFDPGLAGVGVHEIFYTYSSMEGCTSTESDFIEVYDLPESKLLNSACSLDLLTYNINIWSTGSVTTDVGTVVSNGSGNFDILDIPTGTMVIVTTTDPATGCVIDMMVNSPDCSCPMIFAPAVLSNPQICFGDFVPELSAEVANGETIDWYDASTGGNLLLPSSLIYTPMITAPGVYTFYAEARDQKSDCISMVRTAVTLTVNALPEVTFDIADPDICEDETIIALTDGFPEGGEYSGTGVSGSLFFVEPAGVGAHDITYTYTDANGCTNSVTSVLNVRPLPVIDVVPPQSRLCLNDDPMLLSEFQYVFTGNGIQGSFFDPTLAGVGLHTILVEFTDEFGCYNSDTIELEVVPNPVMTIEVVDVLCFGESTGRIIISATGSEPLTYSIDGGATFMSSNTFVDLPAGMYQVVVEGGLGCQVDQTVAITEPPLLTCNVVASGEACGFNDGSIVVSASGGVSPYSYSLEGGPFGASSIFEGLSFGSYTVVVQDNNGCTTSHTVMVDPLCYDLAIQKTFVSPLPISASSVLDFEIELINQGNIVGNMIQFVDQPMPGLVYVGSDAATNTNVSEISPLVFEVGSIDILSSEVVTLSFTIDPNFTGSQFTNATEITVDDGLDADSDPNSGIDVDENSDGSALDDDEDLVVIDFNYDLAIDKEILTNDFSPGAQVTYALTVENQGTSVAQDIRFEDFPDQDLLFVSDNSGSNSNVLALGNLEYEITSLAPGATETIQVTFQINPMLMTGVLVNRAEITADDGFDLDSDPNSDHTVDENGNGSGMDDDEDVVSFSLTDPSAQLGNFVWHDLNANGVQDPGEPGIPNVRIELYDANGDLVSITLTDNNGFYLFNIPAGDYYVQFIDPSGYTLTTANSGTSTIEDSDVDNSNGPSTTAIVRLDNSEVNLSIDAGYYNCVLVGDLIWNDVSSNEMWDANENGINGVNVNAYRMENGTWNLVESTFSGHKPGNTSDDGYWKMCLTPGDYYFEFTNIPTELVSVVPNIGFNEEFDSDVTNANGLNTTDVYTIRSGEERCDIGAGFYLMGTIGDFVWRDMNLNGMQDADEPGVPDIVALAVDLDGNVVNSVTTDDDGRYLLDGIPKGYHYVEFLLPDSFMPTTASVGNDTIDSDVINDGGTIMTQPFYVDSGDHIENVDLGVVAASLPLTWLGLSAEHLDSYNKVEWQTGSEINTSHFEVERSLIGTTDFQTVGRVLAAGNSNTVETYTYDDYDVATSGLYYYRIKQIDIDGRFSYSDVVAVAVSRDSENQALSIYPNPVKDDLQILFETNVFVSQLEIAIYDLAGRKLDGFRIVDYDISAGSKHYQIDVSDYADGSYYLKLSTPRTSFTERLLIIK